MTTFQVYPKDQIYIKVVNSFHTQIVFCFSCKVRKNSKPTAILPLLLLLYCVSAIIVTSTTDAINCRKLPALM